MKKKKTKIKKRLFSQCRHHDIAARDSKRFKANHSVSLQNYFHDRTFRQMVLPLGLSSIDFSMRESNEGKKFQTTARPNYSHDNRTTLR